MPVTARSKASVCGRSLAGTEGSNPAGDMVTSLFVSVRCCQLQISALGRSLVQMSPIECSVSEGDPKTSRIRRTRPTTVVKA
jgi:hypothetical protein